MVPAFRKPIGSTRSNVLCGWRQAVRCPDPVSGLALRRRVATLHGGELKLSDAHPGLRATLAIPARAGASERVAAQTQDMPQKVA